MADARFEDGDEPPLALTARTAEDLAVISALVQDAVLPVIEISWLPRRRRFAVLLNRFRWEDKAAADSAGRDYERVRSLLVVDDVTRVKSNGIDPGDRDLILSVLSLGFEPTDDGAGRIVFNIAGDGQIALDVECIEMQLKDVTRPYRAVSGKAPEHPQD